MVEKSAQEEHHARKLEGLYLFAAAAVIIVGLAVLTALFLPHGTPLQQCEGIVIGQNKDSCLQLLAMSTKNSTVCSYIAEQPKAAACYSAIAVNTTDPSLCTKTGDNLSEFSCVETIANNTGSYSDCSYLNETGKASCLLIGAIANSNQKLCAGIGNESENQICSSTILLDNALKTLNGSYCGKISNSSNYAVTLSVIQHSQIDNYNKVLENTTLILPAALFEPSTSFSARDYCYYALTTETDNRTFCDSVQDQSLASACVSTAESVSNVTSNLTAARNFNFSLVLQACYNQTTNHTACNDTVTDIKAITQENLTTCNDLSDQGEVTTCYIYVAQETHNATICRKILNLSLNNICVQDTSYNSTDTPPPGININ